MFRFYLKLSKKSIVKGLFVWVLFFGFAGSAMAKIPNDPSYPLQAEVYSQIGAPTAWDYTTGSSSVVVAVIDVGVDISHEDLKNNIWKNTDEIAGNGLDDDSNGYVDDVYGWNFVENNNDTAVSVIREVDDVGAVNHGTILAGLIGAQGNNSTLGTGLNWNIKIMPVRAIDNAGGGVLVNVASAVDYAVDNGADIISLSFVGFTTYPGLSAALYRAYQKGVLIVAASGNSGTDSSGNANLTKVKQYPICLDSDYVENWILGVASVDSQDHLSDFADYGSCVDILAPGERIFSTQKFAPQSGFSKKFDGGWYGTSFSAPLVAGSAALIKSVHPEWGAKEITNVLLRSADDVDKLNPAFAGQIGYGRLNVGQAVKMALNSEDTPKSAVVYSSKLVKKPPQARGGQNLYSVQILADGKLLRNFPLTNYSAVLSKWAVADDLFVYARFVKNKIIIDAWDFSGNKKLNNFILPGFNSLSAVTIKRVWGDSPNAIISVKKGKINQKVIIDIPSKSWKVESL
jgi:subtilisin family serine protease